MAPGTRPTWHRRLAVEIPAEADLYEKLKAHQWNATTAIDWSRPIQNFSEAASMNQVPEMETKLCLAGQIIDEARHVEVFGRYLEKLDVEAPLNPALVELVHRLLDTDHYGEKIVGMQIFLEGVAVGLFQRFQTDSPDPLMRDLIRLVLRDESRHAGFGVIYLADTFRRVSAAERRRIEDFVAELWRLFHHATGSPFGPVNGFLADTFADIAHRLKVIGLELRA